MPTTDVAATRELAVAGDLLAVTRRIHVFPDVADLPLRPAAMPAKTAAALDVVSGGRFELGLDAGGYWEAITWMGMPRLTPGEANAALAEAIAASIAAYLPYEGWAGTNLRIDAAAWRAELEPGEVRRIALTKAAADPPRPTGSARRPPVGETVSRWPGCRRAGRAGGPSGAGTRQG